MLGEHLVGTDSEPVDRSGSEVLDDDVGFADERPQDLLRFRVLEVERDRFLAPVEPDEVGGEAMDRRVVGTGKIAAARALDLDHARAEVAEVARAERTGHCLLERQHGDPG
jgi:hypothetical protein